MRPSDMRTLEYVAIVIAVGIVLIIAALRWTGQANAAQPSYGFGDPLTCHPTPSGLVCVRVYPTPTPRLTPPPTDTEP